MNPDPEPTLAASVSYKDLLRKEVGRVEVPCTVAEKERHDDLMVRLATETTKMLRDLISQLKTEELNLYDLNLHYINILDSEKNPEGTQGALRLVAHATRRQEP